MISFSDCHFCQQLGNGRQLIEYLKKIDLIEENEILRAYWDRLTKMKALVVDHSNSCIEDVVRSVNTQRVRMVAFSRCMEDEAESFRWESGIAGSNVESTE